MALAGVHIRFGNFTSMTSAPTMFALSAKPSASQTMTTAGTSTVAASQDNTVLTLNASAPIFYATGPAPDASGAAPRNYYDPASGRESVYVANGDKVAWVFA